MVKKLKSKALRGVGMRVVHEGSCGTRAQGRPSKHKSELHLRGRRAAGMHGPGGNDQTACAHVCGRFLATGLDYLSSIRAVTRACAIWNCIIYI